MAKRKEKEIKGSIKDLKHKELIMEKQKLEILESHGKITQEEKEEKLKEINARIEFNVQTYIEGLRDNRIKKEKVMEEKKMSEEKTEKPVKPKKVTNSDIILELLQKKGLKSVADVVTKFKEKKPEAVDKNVRQQVSEIINWVKKGHKRYASYTWNEESFTLTPKE